MNKKLRHPLPPNHHFGYLLTVVLLLFTIYDYVFNSRSLSYSITFLIAGTLAGLVTLIRPSLFAPFNKAWFLLGQLLGKIASPIVLAVIFFIIITPTAFLCRMRGRDELKLKRNSLSSYWIERESASNDTESFKNQF